MVVGAGAVSGPKEKAAHYACDCKPNGRVTSTAGHLLLLMCQHDSISIPASSLLGVIPRTMPRTVHKASKPFLSLNPHSLQQYHPRCLSSSAKSNPTPNSTRSFNASAKLIKTLSIAFICSCALTEAALRKDARVSRI